MSSIGLIRHPAIFPQDVAIIQGVTVFLEYQCAALNRVVLQIDESLQGKHDCYTQRKHNFTFTLS